MTTLQDKWDKFQASGLTGNIRFSSDQTKELNKMHQEMFHKSIDKGCGKCIKSAFIKIFSNKAETFVEKLAKEVIQQMPKDFEDVIMASSPSKKVHMTFPKHTPKTDLLSDIYGDINDPASVQFHAHMVEEISEQSRRLRIPIKTAYVIDSKIYEGALGKKGITITQEGEIDLLVCLQGTTEEIEKTVSKLNPRYIHSNTVIQGYQPLGSALREGNLYRR